MSPIWGWVQTATPRRFVPGDRVLDTIIADVAVTGIYQGRRRMTLTYPVLNRSRRILWLITGQDKADMLPRLSQGDSSIPAGRISRDQSVVLVDEVRLTKGAAGCAVSGP
jgi:6-phosphogluconolactonase